MFDKILKKGYHLEVFINYTPKNIFLLTFWSFRHFLHDEKKSRSPEKRTKICTGT